MYSSYPRRDQIAIKASLGFAWAFTGIAGAAGVFLTPVTVQQEVGALLPTTTSAISLLAGIFALYGIIRNKYYYEWIAAWFAAAGAITYVSTVWGLVIFGSTTRLQQAANLTALLGFYITRIFINAAHARKQREIHDLLQSGKVDLPNANKSD